VANQYYQFAFTFSPQSLTTSFQTQGASSWTQYQEPNFSRGQPRSGGPNHNNPNGPAGNYLVASSGDTVFIKLIGPSGWQMAPQSKLMVIVSQANWPGQSQGYSPFSNNYVFYPLDAVGGYQSDGSLNFQLDTVQPSANPGNGNFNRYELTVAFAAQDGSGNLYYFADDPEMDVQGS